MARLRVFRSSLVFAASLAPWLAFAACGGSGGNLFPDADAGPDATRGLDGPSPLPDAAADSGKDGGSPNEAGEPDAGAPDEGVDAPVDVGVDAGEDAGEDAGVDAGVDAGIDAGFDAGIDSGVDAAEDSGTVCAAPSAGEWFVAPDGSDTTGTGSQGCPFQTITHAIAQLGSASAVHATINLVSGTSVPNVYGAGCTAGGSGCDITPITVPASVTHGLTIQGTGTDPTLAVVVGGTTANDTSVFDVLAPAVGFSTLTVSPRRIATGTGNARVAGAVGISFDAALAGGGQGEASVINTIVDGVIKTAASDSTSSGIRILGGTSPTIGPDVTIVGGDHAVLVTDSAAGASKPVITTAANATTFFHSTQFACVRVETNNAAHAAPSASLLSSSASTQVHLQDCGGNGGVVVDTLTAGTAVSVVDTLIDASASSGTVADYGVRLMDAGVAQLGGLQASAAASVDIRLMNVAGIEALGTSRLVVAGAVSVTGSHGVGVHVTGTATASIDGLTATGNGSNTEGHGLVCDSSGALNGVTLVLGRSTFLSNLGDGVLISAGAGAATGCVADLGGGASAASGSVTYNDSSQRNGLTGLCYLTTNGPAATPTASTWSCGASAPGCQAENPPALVPVLGDTCAADTDYSNGAGEAGGGGNLTVPATGQTCCGN